MENEYLPDKEIDACLIEAGNKLRAEGFSERTISSTLNNARHYIVLGGVMATNNALKELNRRMTENVRDLELLNAVLKEKYKLELQNKELKHQLKIIKLKQLCNSQDK